VIAIALLLLGSIDRPARPTDAAFAIGLYQQLRTEPGNVIVCPLDAARPLRLIEHAAGGETAKEIDLALRGDGERAPKNAVNTTMFWGDGVRLAPGMALPFQAVAFSDPQAARRQINAWVSAATKKRIVELLGPDAIKPDARLMVTSATYFEGQWKSQFDPSETTNRRFHLAGGSDVTVPTMRQELYARTANLSGLRLLELEYLGDGLTMLIALPPARDKLPAVEASLTAERLAAWTAALRGSGPLEVELPRFHARTTSDLKNALQALGVRRLFDPARAELPGFIASRHLFLAGALQETRVDVDEVGTIASSASHGDFVFTGTEVPPKPIPFHIDRPFLFVIRDRTGVLIIGRITDPR
jgi:serpin B